MYGWDTEQLVKFKYIHEYLVDRGRVLVGLLSVSGVSSSEKTEGWEYGRRYCLSGVVTRGRRRRRLLFAEG